MQIGFCPRLKISKGWKEDLLSVHLLKLVPLCYAATSV